MKTKLIESERCEKHGKLICFACAITAAQAVKGTRLSPNELLIARYAYAYELSNGEKAVVIYLPRKDFQVNKQLYPMKDIARMTSNLMKTAAARFARLAREATVIAAESLAMSELAHIEFKKLSSKSLRYVTA